MTLLPGLTYQVTHAFGSMAQESQRDTTRFPSAKQNWFNFECIGFKKLNDVPYPLTEVVAEYDRKVADHSSVPPLRVGNNCRRVTSEDRGVVGVRAGHFGDRFCSRWDPGPNRIALNLDRPGFCRGHAREFMCSAVGQAIGANLYKRTPAGVAKGCLWTTDVGPNHVSKRERKVIIRAWDRRPGDRGTHWDRAVSVGVLKVAVPRNHVPCRYDNSNHCTHSGKFSGTRYSWWYGDKVGRHHKNYITPKRARIRMQTYFRYYNWTYIGRWHGHPYCWDNLNGNVRCGDGKLAYYGGRVA